MMEENNYIFPCWRCAVVYLAEPMHKKYSTTFGGVHLIRTHLTTDFSPPPLLLLCARVHILSDPLSIPPVVYVLNGWPIS